MIHLLHIILIIINVIMFNRILGYPFKDIKGAIPIALIVAYILFYITGTGPFYVSDI